MNKKQKIVVIAGIILILGAFIIWLLSGTEVFTKTQVMVDKTTELDRMLGVENKQYVDKFILGLDYTGAFAAGVAVISGILFYLFRNKNKEMT